MNRVLAGFAVCSMLGCATQAPTDIDSPYYQYRAAIRLIVNQPIAIGPGEASARLQYGTVVARNGVQEVDPWCILEISTVGDAAQVVRPAEFEITRIERYSSTIADARGFGVGFRPVMDDNSSGPTQIFYKTEFRLHSDMQPAVRSLTCQSDQNAPGVAPFMRHLTLAEIRSALGKLATLRLPD